MNTSLLLGVKKHAFLLMPSIESLYMNVSGWVHCTLMIFIRRTTVAYQSKTSWVTDSKSPPPPPIRDAYLAEYLHVREEV